MGGRVRKLQKISKPQSRSWKGFVDGLQVSRVLKLIESGMRCQRTSKEDLSHRYRKFSEPQLRSWLALDTPSKCQNRSFTKENCHSSVSNRVRSKVTSLNDGWDGPKTKENFKTPVTLVEGVCGWMGSFWVSESNRVRDEVPTHIERGPLTQNRSFTIENCHSSVSNRVRSRVTSLNDGWDGPKIKENFKTPVTLVERVCGWIASF
ncbi:hypothetical protein U1Q18_050303 [Sarracenia purpurea var. burkii]